MLEIGGFGFSEEEEMIQRQVRNFAKKELAPTAKERAQLDHMPWDIIKKIADLGLVGIGLPEKYGGQPGSWLSTGIVIEELAKADFAAAHLIQHVRGLCIALEKASEEMQREWLPALIRGQKMICLGLTEPNCGSDAAAIETTAVRDGNDYVITGEKVSCTYALQSEVAIIFAKTDRTAGARGVSAFLVPLDLPGVERTSDNHTGFRPQRAGTIFLNEVRVNARQRIGDEGKGFYMVMGQFDVIRVFIGLEVIGIAQTSLDEAVAYAKQRHAFGRAIAKFEGISFSIAEHATLLEACRLLCYQALRLKDKGMRHTKESAMCKWLCPKVAVDAIHRALLIHGNIGYSTNYPLEQRLRDVMGTELADGTAEIMKAIIAREIMGKEYLPYDT